ncbi:MAG: T9SS type A sorting domain-containing protein [Bacteroidia bacterium]
MKRNLLLSFIAVAMGMNVYSQNVAIPQSKKLIPRSIKGILVQQKEPHTAKGGGLELPVNNNKGHRILTNQHQNISNSANKMGGSEEKLGDTQYDLQTNEAILNRFVRNSDGTMSASWTYVPFGDLATAASRGTGYNYFDGTSWGPWPTVRIEPTDRTGFVNIVVTSSGKEMSIAHSSTLAPAPLGGMLLTSRPAKGTGAWTEYPTALGKAEKDTWSKAIAGGANGETVHVICQGSGSPSVPLYGQDGPVLYSRSLDGGDTWPVLRTVIPAIDSTHYKGFQGDGYSIDTKGDEVAIVTGGWVTDLVLLKSMDNGTTWTSTIINQFPIAMYDDAAMMLPDTNGDGVGDNLEGNAGDAHVMIDNNGMCHVWYSTILIQDTSIADALGGYSNSSDGLYYWNEGFGANAPVIIAEAEDLNHNGQIDIPSTSTVPLGGMGGYRGGLTQMPSSGIDAAGSMYVAYQSFDELSDTTFYPGIGHKHIYVIKSLDNGVTWSCPFDALNTSPDSTIQEGVFACMAKSVDTDVHLIYQRDYAPGHALSTNTTEAGWNLDPSDIIYVKIPVTDLDNFNCTTGINDNLNSTDFNVAQNVPNPATGITSITVTTAKTAKVTFTVTDVVGKVVYTENRGTVSPGSFTINFNTNQINKGLYFYTVKVGDNSVTKKMIVE